MRTRAPPEVTVMHLSWASLFITCYDDTRAKELLD